MAQIDGHQTNKENSETKNLSKNEPCKLNWNLLNNMHCLVRAFCNFLVLSFHLSWLKRMVWFFAVVIFVICIHVVIVVVYVNSPKKNNSLCTNLCSGWLEPLVSVWRYLIFRMFLIVHDKSLGQLIAICHIIAFLWHIKIHHSKKKLMLASISSRSPTR